MFIERAFPFLAAPLPARKSNTADISADDGQAIKKTFRIGALGLGFNTIGWLLTSKANTRTTFESAPYDFERIVEAIDTDSYVKQGISKYKELFWKEGYEILGENTQAVGYLLERLDFLEIAMNRTFDDFLVEVVDQLVKFGNVFIAEYRNDDIRPYFPGRMNPPQDMAPITGYYIIPTETVRIRRDKNNVPLEYIQMTDPSMIFSDKDFKTLPRWNADEIIHLHLDKKPGRAFGTPFIATALDDVIALRQIEQDILNLIHRELFPLYKYTVGTEAAPAEPEELNEAIEQLEHLRSEGGLVLPDRHNVEVIGSEGHALQIKEYLDHFKHRVAMGLGVYPHHLGMSDGGNRAASDRLDIALYDRIKVIQKYVSEAVRIYIFNKLLLEGSYSPYQNPLEPDVSDRVILRFREIDADTQAKKENMVIQRWANNLITSEEARMALGYDPHIDDAHTFTAMQTRLMPNSTVKNPVSGATTTVDTTPPAALKPDGQTSSNTKGTPNMPNPRKGPGNAAAPSNQFGRRLSPNIRHSDELLNDIVELLDIDVIEE